MRTIMWKRLKTSQFTFPLDFPKIMEKVEKKCLQPGDFIEENVNALFERFATLLEHYFEKTRHSSMKVPVCERECPGWGTQITPEHLRWLQARLQIPYENEALEKIWNCRLAQQFRNQEAFKVSPEPVGHEAIRTWLSDTPNDPQIQQITNLSLRVLDLTILPSEIELFRGLNKLDLSNNQLKELPELDVNLTSRNRSFPFLTTS